MLRSDALRMFREHLYGGHQTALETRQRMEKGDVVAKRVSLLIGRTDGYSGFAGTGMQCCQHHSLGRTMDPFLVIFSHVRGRLS